MCRGNDKQLNMRFMRTPVEMVSGQLGRVSGVTLEKTKLQQEGSKQVAVRRGEFETIQVGANPSSAIPGLKKVLSCWSWAGGVALSRRQS